MKTSVLIPLPGSFCEIATAEKLRKAKHVYSAHMVKAGLVTVCYNAKKTTKEDVIKLTSKKRKSKAA